MISQMFLFCLVVVVNGFVLEHMNHQQHQHQVMIVMIVTSLDIRDLRNLVFSNLVLTSRISSLADLGTIGGTENGKLV